ncbi:hypothetical protein [Convivina praedatoris]|uniref:Large polyvalent protein associated domain-containing protein n=1 Tax=Convivina praedatoris TaxID=2880963 RepID=A0ABN8HEG8_9LACO|nr:hypothetical protein [Convivina sp. LMG 32447]CAH1854534.1 hypothetical protein R077815_01076 [Convivina sp. LMG 32447]CAH1855895.1 hypothetical protein LMG032447_01190 [Convivina sp. LMG 32447]
MAISNILEQPMYGEGYMPLNLPKQKVVRAWRSEPNQLGGFCYMTMEDLENDYDTVYELTEDSGQTIVAGSSLGDYIKQVHDGYMNVGIFAHNIDGDDILTELNWEKR